MASHRVTRPWTKHEDQILRTAVSQFNQTETIDWHKVASNLPRRNNKECRKRWVYSLESRISKGPWDSDEDALLKKGVAKYGLKWAAVAEVVASRQPDQCSRRWHEVVNPRISHERWSLLEDEILKEAVDTYGRKWTEIVERFFPNRTPISARNRFKQRFESRAPTTVSERQSSASSDEKTSNLLWSVRDHSQGNSPAYEAPPYNQMPPTSAGSQWSAPSSVHGSVSPHPTNFHSELDLLSDPAYAHSRSMSQPDELSHHHHHRSVNSYGSAFTMGSLMSDPESASNFGSPHGYPSPLSTEATMSAGFPVGPPHFESYSYSQPPEQNFVATNAPPNGMMFDSPDQYMSPGLPTELDFTVEERYRLMNARAQMKQSATSGSSRHGRTAPNVQTMAF